VGTSNRTFKLFELISFEMLKVQFRKGESNHLNVESVVKICWKCSYKILKVIMWNFVMSTMSINSLSLLICTSQQFEIVDSIFSKTYFNIVLAHVQHLCSNVEIVNLKCWNSRLKWWNDTFIMLINFYTNQHCETLSSTFRVN
jgi:hypothetical protein